MSTAQSKSQTVLVTPGIPVQNMPLDNFIARSVTVDNPTGQWFYLPNQQRWVAPFTLGTIIALNSGQEGASAIQSGVSLVNIQSQTPAGQMSRPANGQHATFVFSTTDHPNAAGTTSSVGIQNLAGIQNVVTVPANNSVTIQFYTVPPGVVTQVDSLFISLPASASAQQISGEFFVFENGSSVVIFQIYSETNLKMSGSYSPNLLLSEGTIIQLIGLNFTTNTVGVSGSMFFREIRTT